MRRFSFIYVLGIIYGSLIPFHFRSLDFGTAFERFVNIPYLDLGVVSRADWIANGVLYLPLGFAILACFPFGKSSSHKTISWGLVVCLLVAVGVEFLQIYTSNRTVSLNDILAEGIGSLLGITLWLCWGDRWRRLWNSFHAGGDEAVDAALIFYCLFFLGYSLFPFDFLLSFPEISWKISAGHHGLLFVEGGGGVRGFISLGMEAFSVVPLGMLLARKIDLTKKDFPMIALIYGGALGLSLEGLQFFLASGTTQGLSVLAKGLGLGAGVMLHRSFQPRWIVSIKSYIPATVMLCSVPYLLAVLYLRGWFSHQWLDADKAMAKVNISMVMPFYYHYFSPETVALVSLVSNALLYGMIGLGGYLVCSSSEKLLCGRMMAAVCAACLAFLMESGRLFLDGKFPDFTNVIIAWLSAWLVYGLIEKILRWPWFSCSNSPEGRF